jgi:ATP-binding cassette subfamily C protein
MFGMVKSAFKNYTKDMTVIILLSVISSLTNGISVVMLIPMLDVINISGTDMGIFSFAVSLFSNMPYSIRILVLLLVYIALMLFVSLVNRYMAIYNTRFVQRYVKQLRLSVYDAVIDADWEVLTAQKHEDLLNSFTNETSQISNAITIFPVLISIIIAAVTQLSIAFALNVPLTAIVLLVGGIFFFSFRRFFDIARKNGERMRIANRRYLGEIKNQLDSIKEIKSYGVEETHKEMLHEVLNEYEDANIKRTRMSTLPTLLFSMSSTVLIAIIFYIANVMLKVDTVELLLIVYIFARIWPVFSKFHREVQNLYNALPSFDNVRNIMDTLGKTEAEKPGREGHIELHNEIVFDNVTFSYSSSDEKILKNTTFSIKANSITAIRGKSGVGKSTIVDLLMGLLKPVGGTISIDSEVLDTDNLRAWRKSIGYMPQEPIILNKSIRENITRFNPSTSDGDIIEALEKAQALGFINKLPEGLDTMMGNKGIRLSGGEKQRIALGRALVSRPSVLILDEATSSLDRENEGNILEILKSLKDSVTVIVIAHRDSTVAEADYIIDVSVNGTVDIRENKRGINRD